MMAGKKYEGAKVQIFRCNSLFVIFFSCFVIFRFAVEFAIGAIYSSRDLTVESRFGHVWFVHRASGGRAAMPIV